MRSDRLRLRDILDAIEVVIANLPPDRATFDADPPIQSHIYRHLLIVGEAAWRLSPAVKQQYPKVAWKQIEGMRHILVHDYFKVDWDVVYNTAKTHIPVFKLQVEMILREL